MPADGGAIRRLTFSEGGDILPSWSSDGQWVYFSSQRSQADEVWKIPAQGGPAVQVTDGGGWESFESRDGSSLYYSTHGDTIRRLDLSTGAVDELDLGDAGRIRYWALADEGIYFVDSNSDPGSIQFFGFLNHEIRRVASIGTLVHGPGGLAVSPDGRSLLFVQEDVGNRDIMLVEGLQ